MPATFPNDTFHEFEQTAVAFFPKILSDEDLQNPLKRQCFERARQAVRYRYRACTECNEEFKSLLHGASDLWREWGADEELNYKLERCLYLFFMSGLSIFESLGFCLYFVGVAIRPKHFPDINDPWKITLAKTVKAFRVAFPQVSITYHLSKLLKEPEFKKINTIRNIIAHRLIGTRYKHDIASYRDGTCTQRETREGWHLPGLDNKLMFDEQLIQCHLDNITGFLKPLITASLELVTQHKPRAHCDNIDK